jgi:uncharacterized repeat protein (TIGR02543 family)
VKYTKDGVEVIADTYPVTKQVWILDPVDATVPVDAISAENDRYPGYILDIDPFVAPATAQDGDVITVPYVKVYTVTFLPGDPEMADPEFTAETHPNLRIDAPMPTPPHPKAKFGFKFVGWIDDAGNKYPAPDYKNPTYVPTLPDKVTGNQTFTAMWDDVNKNQKFPDKIPSVTHVDKWWEDYGILCFGASTGDLPYFVGFEDWFFEVYNKVGIGFGTSGSWPYVATFYPDKVVWEKHVTPGLVGANLIGSSEAVLKSTEAAGYQVSRYVKYDGVADAYGYHKNVIFDAQYTAPKDKNHRFDDAIKNPNGLRGIWFDDPWGTGARQAWLGFPADLFGNGGGTAPVTYTATAELIKVGGKDTVTIKVMDNRPEEVARQTFQNVGKKETIRYTFTSENGAHKVDVTYDNGGKIISATVAV